MDHVTAPAAVCAACHRPLPAWDPDRIACPGCQQRAYDQLTWLPGLYKLLGHTPGTTAPMVGTRHGTTGWRPPAGWSTHISDLTADHGILETVATCVRNWSATGNHNLPDCPPDRAGAVTEACRWLRWHLDWACRNHADIALALSVIGTAYRQVHGAVTGEHGERRVGLTCQCGHVIRVTASTKGTTCEACGTEYGRAEVFRLTPTRRANAA